jgi:hypothetical protein
MSRRTGEFEHRTSIFEGAFRAWSHLGGLKPADLENHTASNWILSLAIRFGRWAVIPGWPAARASNRTQEQHQQPRPETPTATDWRVADNEPLRASRYSVMASTIPTCVPF